jgi:hypothetical protein
MLKALPLLLLSVVTMAACDERRQPSNPPGTEVGTGTPGQPSNAPPPPPAGGIPAGQGEPQQPQTPQQ